MVKLVVFVFKERFGEKEGKEEKKVYLLYFFFKGKFFEVFQVDLFKCYQLDIININFIVIKSFKGY